MVNQIVTKMRKIKNNKASEQTAFKKGADAQYLQLDLLVRQKILHISQQLDSIPSVFKKSIFVERLNEAHKQLVQCFALYRKEYHNWLVALYDHSLLSFTAIVTDDSFVMEDAAPVELVFKFE